MSPNEYQDLASKTAGKHDMPIYTALGLGGEAGEILDLTKKWLYHGHPYDRQKFLDELGDLAWYLSQAAKAHHLTLEEIFEYNIAKLKTRYPEGFSTERSVNRDK